MTEDIKKPLSKPKKGRYIVWSPEGMTEPRKVHTTHGEACAIGWHMAKLHKGQTFYIMQQAGKPAYVEIEEQAA